MRSMTTVPRMPQFDRREASEDADEGPGTKRAVWPVIVTAEGVEGRASNDGSKQPVLRMILGRMVEFRDVRQVGSSVQGFR
jgi:hypothetical protein